MHLMRRSGTVSLAAAACSMDMLQVWGRWAMSEGVVAKSYLPKSPLSALPATGILAGFGTDFMTNHAFGRGTVAVPVAWIDALAPQAQVIFQAFGLRNRMRTGKADFSGQHCVESILYLIHGQVMTKQMPMTATSDGSHALFTMLAHKQCS